MTSGSVISGKNVVTVSTGKLDWNKPSTWIGGQPPRRTEPKSTHPDLSNER